jgi:hypothetical protein
LIAVACFLPGRAKDLSAPTHNDNIIDEVKSTKFLGTHIDNHLNWKNHVEKILPKSSAACFSLRKLIHNLNPDILHMV